ncbi:casein kinase II subunit alpha'-interacting protein [Ctenodactylus gundi]
MMPLEYYDQNYVPLDHSYQLATTNSLTHQSNREISSQVNKQPLAKIQTYSKNPVIHQLSSNGKIQNSSILPTPKSQMTIPQGLSNRAITSPLSLCKSPVTSSLDLHQRSSLSPAWKAFNSSLSYSKPQKMSSSDLSKTSSSLEPKQTTLGSELPIYKLQTTSSSENLHWTSQSLKSNLRVLSSSLSHLQHQETPIANSFWASSSLRPNHKSYSSTLLSSKFQTASLDDLWTSLLVQNQRSLSSPTLNTKLQTNGFIQTPPSLERDQMAAGSPLPDSRPQKDPTLSSNPTFLRLPPSHEKLRQSPFSHSTHQCESSPALNPKSQTVLTVDRNFQMVSSSICHSKFQNTTSKNDKHHPIELPTSQTKPNVSGQSLPSDTHCVKNIASWTWSSGLQRKSSFDTSAKTESEKDISWTLHYCLPCIVKGGTMSDDVVNRIVSSLSKSRIQRDLSRQILLRRMRGKPNPRPGPRLLSTYTVCLVCASCIKSQCNHITGKKGPHCATLFVIPIPEASSEGKIAVKLVLILSLPEASFSPLVPPPPVDGKQPHEALHDENLKDVEKIPQVPSTSEPSIIQELSRNTKCSLMSPENKFVSQQSQAASDWLLYVKKSSNLRSRSQTPSPFSSSSSSSSSSVSSTMSSLTSFSSSSFAFPPEPPPPRGAAPPALSGCVLADMLSCCRLPPGVSWLEFICSEDYHPLPGKPKKMQLSAPQRKPASSATTVKGTNGPSVFLRFFQTKFQNEKP